MQMLGVTIPIEKRAADVIWYGHVLRRNEGYILKEALNFELIDLREDALIVGENGH